MTPPKSIPDKAQELWAAMTANEQTGVRFGLFPASPMRIAEAEGYDARELTLALMDLAKQNGGMRA